MKYIEIEKDEFFKLESLGFEYPDIICNFTSEDNYALTDFECDDRLYEIFKKISSSSSMSIIAQDLMKTIGANWGCVIDEEEKSASDTFTGAINYAARIFVYRLMLGGSYTTNKEDKLEIKEHLSKIMHIIEKYKK